MGEPALSHGLKALFEANGVGPEVTSWLATSGCVEVAHLANWVDDRTELREAVLNKTSVSGDTGQLAALKQAWREADAQTSRALKRATESLPSEDYDSPLDASVQKDLEKAWRSYYNWPSIPSKRMGADSLLGRISREFQRRQPTMVSVQRVRSLAKSQRGTPAKLRKLSEGVSLQLGEGEEDDDTTATSGLYHYLSQLEILCTTWSVAGIFQVEGAPFCHWWQVQEYAFCCSEKAHEALARNTEESVVHYVSTVEECFRARAVELTRGQEQLTWGKALLQAQRDLASKWAESSSLLVSRRNNNAQRPERPSRPEKPGRPGKPGGPPGGPPGREQPGKPGNGPRAQTANDTASGASICKKWNDSRGCKGKSCPQGKVHCCDVRLALGGRACGSKKHSRGQHDAQRDGAPATLN